MNPLLVAQEVLAVARELTQAINLARLEMAKLNAALQALEVTAERSDADAAFKVSAEPVGDGLPR